MVNLYGMYAEGKSVFKKGIDDLLSFEPLLCAEGESKFWFRRFFDSDFTFHSKSLDIRLSKAGSFTSASFHRKPRAFFCPVYGDCLKRPGRLWTSCVSGSRVCFFFSCSRDYRSDS